VRTRNIIVPAFIGAGTLVYLFESLNLPFGSAHMPDMGFVPVVIGCFVLGVSLLAVARGLISLPQTKGLQKGSPAAPADDAGSSKPVVAISTAIFVYPLLLVNLGFILSTSALMAICLWMMHFRGWLACILVAVGSTAVAYVLFGLWLKVYLPRGLLG
jgi:Tripartite tricarboxylate transporter TctB family